MIEARIELPLAHFTLRADLRLPSAVTALMGPSGSGKTSLLEALAGLRPRARGRIHFDGTVWLDTAGDVCLPPEKRRVGYVPQDAGLFPHLTAGANVRFGVRAAPQAVATAVETLDIGALLERYPASLSGGEKQRVALARALATRPRLLLFDEPLAALDEPLRERILPYLVRIRDDWKVPCLYVTHNVGEALAIAEHLVLLREGAVEAEGPPNSLLSAPTVIRESEAGLENLLSGRVEVHDPEGGVTRILLEGGLRLSAPLAAQRTVGSAVTVAFRAEDLLLVDHETRGLSARNIYPATVAGVERAGANVTVRCVPAGAIAGPQWLARVTPAAAAALGLAAGEPIHLAIKSHSVRLL